MNKEEFIKFLNDNNLPFNDKIEEQLDIYANYLIEYNTHTNLTAIKDINSIYLKHFLDSIMLAKYIDLNKYNTLLDVGSGAGFPGMILKIFYPHLKVTLLDSNNKKTTFLENLAEKLNLDNIEIINARSEEYAKNNREYYDLVTSRAVANMSVLAEISLPLVKVEGYFIPLKANIDEELDQAKNIINILNGQIEDIINYTLPIENATRNIIKIKKVKETPIKYPRTYNKILSSLANSNKIR